MRLFCFPYAGSGANVFSSWASYLPGVEVCGVELPGRGRRFSEALYRRLTPLAEAIAGLVRSHLGMPFALFGHSMGALLAFEVARRLRRDGQPEPVHLFVSGCRGPRLERRAPRYDLSDHEFIEELRRLNGMPAEALAHAEFMETMLPIVRADFETLDTYVYRAVRTLACPITVFGGVQDHEAPSGDLDVWRQETSGPMSLHMLPGDHFFLDSARDLLLFCVSAELEAQVRIPERSRS